MNAYCNSLLKATIQVPISILRGLVEAIDRQGHMNCSEERLQAMINVAKADISCAGLRVYYTAVSLIGEEELFGLTSRPEGQLSSSSAATSSASSSSSPASSSIKAGATTLLKQQPATSVINNPTPTGGSYTYHHHPTPMEQMQLIPPKSAVKMIMDGRGGLIPAAGPVNSIPPSMCSAATPSRPSPSPPPPPPPQRPAIRLRIIKRGQSLNQPPSLPTRPMALVSDAIEPPTRPRRHKSKKRVSITPIAITPFWRNLAKRKRDEQSPDSDTEDEAEGEMPDAKRTKIDKGGQMAVDL